MKRLNISLNNIWNLVKNLFDKFWRYVVGLSIIVTLMIAFGFQPISILSSAKIGAINFLDPNRPVVEIQMSAENKSSGSKNIQADTVEATVGDVIEITTSCSNLSKDNQYFVNNSVLNTIISGNPNKSHVIQSTFTCSKLPYLNKSITINTDLNTQVRYVPGSAQRRMNKGTKKIPHYEYEKISDESVLEFYMLGSLKPGIYEHESLIFQLKVFEPVLQVTSFLKKEGDNQWNNFMDAKPGEVIAYLIQFTNATNQTLNHVVIRESVNSSLKYVEGSTKLFVNSSPGGVVLSDELIEGGFDVGNYGPGSGCYIRFNVKLPDTMPERGYYKFYNYSFVKAEGVDVVSNTCMLRVNY